MDIDIDAAEALFKPEQQENQNVKDEETRDDRDERKSKKKKHGRSRSRSYRSRSRSSRREGRRQRSRSRSDSRKRKHRHRSRSSKRDKRDRKDRKDSRRSRSREDNRRDSRDHSSQRDYSRLSAKEQIEQRRKDIESQIEKLNKEADEANREDKTVMIYQIPTRADERDIWTYLTKYCGCSKVRDIKLIKDQKTKRFKGVAYAEFYTKEDVDAALASDTRPFIYQGEEVPMSEIRLQRSHAEKNRVAQAVKKMKQQKAEALKEQLARLQDGPGKIFVSGLGGKLTKMTSQELKDIFQQFGDIEYVELPQNPLGQNLGFGFVVFKNRSDGDEAIEKMNGFQLQDQKITCTHAAVNLNMAMLLPPPPMPIAMPQYYGNSNGAGNSSNYSVNHQFSFTTPAPQAAAMNDYSDTMDLGQNENKIFLHTAQQRLELMKKLAGNAVNIPGLDKSNSSSQVSNMGITITPAVTSVGNSSSYFPVPGNLHLPNLNIAQNQTVQDNFLAGNRPPTSVVPTNFIVLVNMFQEKDSESDPSFFADLKEDVAEECKKFGEITDVFVAVKSPCGSVFVLFTNNMSAVNCAKAMDGRNFNHRPISCYCITEDTLQDELQKNL